MLKRSTLPRRLLPRTIRRSLLLLLLFVLVPVTFAEAGLHYRRFEERRVHELQDNVELAKAIALTFEARIGDLVHDDLALGLAILDLRLRDSVEMGALLSAQAREHPYIRSLHWASPDGRVIASSDPRAIGSSIGDRPAFEAVLAGRDWAVSDLFQGPRGDPSFAIVSGSRDESGNLRGVVHTMVNANRLDAALGIERRGGGVIEIVDSRGWLVYRHPETVLAWDQRDALAKRPGLATVLEGAEVSGRFVSLVDGKPELAGMVPIRSIGWVASASFPEAEALRPLLSDLFRNIATLLVFGGAGFVAAVLLGRQITRQVTRLQTYALDLAYGRVDDPVEVAGLDELDKLADTFSHMATQVASRERQLGLVNKNLMRAVSEAREAAEREEALNKEVVAHNEALKASNAALVRAQNTLAESEERFRALFERAPIGIAVIRNWVTLLANPAAAAILRSQDTGEQLGSNILDHIEPQAREEVTERETRRVQGHDVPSTFETIGRRRDGSQFPMRVSVAAMRLPDGPATVAFFTDVTDVKMAEAALRQARDQLEVRVQERTAELAFTAESLRVEIAERKLIHDYAQRQLHRLAALRTIDIAIAGSVDLSLTAGVILDQLTSQLGVDAAVLMFLNRHTLELEFSASRGFRTRAIENSHLGLDDKCVAQAILERRIAFIQDLKASNEFARSALLADEGFSSYFCAPLVSQGHVAGVLEAYHREALDPDDEWLHFLETLAGQAAIAIENASLFDDLRRSHDELLEAYDTTIEGWARALDMRDHETEGHSRRVTDVTVRIARALEVSDADLVHIRRGALLHDIGKLGIPDAILLKNGPLTNEEWQIMHKHPVHAYDMLTPIPHMRPAVDIPYCHHEKWDGSGYPRALQGEAIPLAARIFAVADVWDALRYDRPYRAGWTAKRVREYIKTQAGKHFDPKVVEAFLSLDVSEA